MNFDLAFNYWIIQSLRDIGAWFEPLMQLFTWLGNPQAYMVIIAVIYWSIDRKLGLRMAIFLLVAASFNTILKQAFHSPRPYWTDLRLKPIQVENGFGMPSGHAQASTVWLLIAAHLRSVSFWSVAVVITFLIGLSRIYLGVHFPSQVLAGWMIGIVLLIIFLRMEAMLVDWFKDMRLHYQILFVSGITILILFFGGMAVLSLKDWDMPADWIRNASPYLSETGETIRSSIGMVSIIGNAGGFLGAALGGILIQRQGGFNISGPWWKRLMRCVVGLSLILIIYVAFRYSGPDPASVYAFYLWRFCGFFTILFSEIFLIPLLLKRIKLLS